MERIMRSKKRENQQLNKLITQKPIKIKVKNRLCDNKLQNQNC